MRADRISHCYVLGGSTQKNYEELSFISLFVLGPSGFRLTLLNLKIDAKSQDQAFLVG